VSRIQLIRGLAGTMTTADLSDNDSGTVAQVSFTAGRGFTVTTNTILHLQNRAKSWAVRDTLSSGRGVVARIIGWWL
jgi:hypothetical protein